MLQDVAPAVDVRNGTVDFIPQANSERWAGAKLKELELETILHSLEERREHLEEQIQKYIAKKRMQFKEYEDHIWARKVEGQKKEDMHKSHASQARERSSLPPSSSDSSLTSLESVRRHHKHTSKEKERPDLHHDSDSHNTLMSSTSKPDSKRHPWHVDSRNPIGEREMELAGLFMPGFLPLLDGKDHHRRSISDPAISVSADTKASLPSVPSPTKRASEPNIKTAPAKKSALKHSPQRRTSQDPSRKKSVSFALSEGDKPPSITSSKHTMPRRIGGRSANFPRGSAGDVMGDEIFTGTENPTTFTSPSPTTHTFPEATPSVSPAPIDTFLSVINRSSNLSSSLPADEPLPSRDLVLSPSTSPMTTASKTAAGQKAVKIPKDMGTAPDPWSEDPTSFVGSVTGASGPDHVDSSSWGYPEPSTSLGESYMKSNAKELAKHTSHGGYVAEGSSKKSDEEKGGQEDEDEGSESQEIAEADDEVVGKLDEDM
ncbi:hypothetical protein M501DRAFT_987089 [Patellaria atrata CBS 101060]|uniref:Uncharacterized protein n=1 Tax=Patellaria atrata CBS 101060 TaxID=1346257 RepID=A0A9P4S6F3_9PEZI|nr:hypothetical protein M501DRAFT_987089 [Patellaria atrata CBS 101060]